MNATHLRPALLALVTTVLACDGTAGVPGGAEPLDTVTAEITTVPTGVTCVGVALTGSTTANKTFTVSGGSGATLDLGRLNAGTVTAVAQAYTVACSSVSSSTTSAWISDATTFQVIAGLGARVSLFLRPNNPSTATVDFAQPAVGVAAGNGSSYAVMADGTARAWGDNSSGQLGDGTTIQRPRPVTIANLGPVKQITGGWAHACALTTDGRAQCWGDNSFGGLGDGTTTRRSSAAPVSMPTGVTFANIAAGIFFTCAVPPISNASPVFCWGANSEGALGDGTRTMRLTPTAAMTVASVEVATGSAHTCVTQAVGSPTCWGNNSFGQNGRGPSSSILSPGPSGFEAAVQVGAGNGFTCALQGNGSVLCAGDNSLGALGNGTNASQPGAVTVLGVSGATQIAAGRLHVCARLSNGTVRCWGSNFAGQLGDGTITDRNLAVAVIGLSNVTAVAAGEAHTCALKTDGSVWCWGRNGLGQLGDGTFIQRFTPVRAQL